MLIGIEESTDRARPEACIVKFRTERQSRRWLASPGRGYVDPGAADATLPLRSQNFHRWLREVYVMPPGFRLSAKQVEAEWHHRTRYPLGYRQAIVYRRHALRRLE